MNSIFSDEGVRQLKYRLSTLKPDSQRKWGKMNVSQMLAHCQGPLNVGTGEHNLPRYNFFLRTIGKMVKRKLTRDEAPFKKGQPTDKSFIVSEDRDFEAERKKLTETIDKFSAAGRADKLGGEHPFFGKLSKDEWDKLSWKHLDHHLRQFGA
jgi:hypothetical protein